MTVTATMQDLPGADWLQYFGSLSFDGEGVLVEVAVIRDELACRGAVRALKAIDYDPSADMLEVVVDGCITGESALRYFIAAPRRIGVAQAPNAGTILVEDEGGIRTLIRLFNLPHPLNGELPGAQLPQVASQIWDLERSM